MASLTARGARVLAKVELTRDRTDDYAAKETIRRAYRSDGMLLECLVVERRNPAPYEERSHNYGWKVRGKIKEGLRADEWVQMYKGKGWKKIG